MRIAKIKKIIIISIIVAGLAGLPAGFLLARDGIPALAAQRSQDTSSSTKTTVRSSIHGNTKTIITTTIETIIHSHDGILRHKHVITVVETQTEIAPNGIFHFLTENATSPGTPAINVTATQNSVPQQPVLSPQTNEITILGRNFFPADLTISVGTTVTWTNKDAESHVVATDSKLFGGMVPPFSSTNFTFNEPGVYNYYCELHSSMTGTITVK